MQPIADLVRRVGTPRFRQTNAELETAYCAEVIAVTYEAMGLIPEGQRPSSYDPGRLWSGDRLDLLVGSSLGREIAVLVSDHASLGQRQRRRGLRAAGGTG